MLRLGNNWFASSLLIVALVTGFRIAGLAFSNTDIFVDEAQYWLWGQNLDFGYYSKPPLIGWVIRGFTELAGSNAPFWIRLPAPLFHGLTALILGLLAVRLFEPRAGLWVAAGYVTLPIVAVGSTMISTDTIMAPFFALALLFYFQLLKTNKTQYAVTAGAMIGLAFMAKYAGIYFLLCAGIAAIFIPSFRISWARLGVLLAAFVLVALPNIIWNLTHDLTTVEHTLDNVDWVREPSGGQTFHFASLAEFFFMQFLVMGPVFFATLLYLTTRAKTPLLRGLLVFSLPIIALVCVQALLSRAYGNWAFAAYFAGVLSVFPWILANRVRWLWAGLVINLAVTLALPILTIVAPTLTLGGDQPLLKRYLGRDELSHQILGLADEHGISAVVTSDRDILADLFLTGHDSGITFFSVKPKGRADNYYQQNYAFDDASDQILLFVTRHQSVKCAGSLLQPISVLDTQGGAYSNLTLSAYLMPPSCYRAIR